MSNISFTKKKICFYFFWFVPLFRPFKYKLQFGISSVASAFVGVAMIVLGRTTAPPLFSEHHGSACRLFPPTF